MAQAVEKISCGEAFLQVLKGSGVEYIFSSPGSEWPPVWEALAKLRAQEEPIPYYINCRHEELAVGMATSYAKATGRLPAVLVHTSVGVMHAAMAMRQAYHEHIPIVVAAGGSSTFGDGSVDPGAQWLRLLSDVGGPAKVAEPYVKWSETVPTAEALPGMIQHACRVALTPPQGPTFLAVPLELLLSETSLERIPKTERFGMRTRPDADALERAAQLLAGSKSPLIITEHSGRNPSNVSRLVALAESLAIPVVEAQTPIYLNFPHDNALHLGFDARPFLDEADVVLLVGVGAPWHPPSRGPKDDATVILADEDTAKDRVPYWNYPIDIYLRGATSVAMDELLAHIVTLKAQGKVDERRVEERRTRYTAEHQRQRQTWQGEADAHASAKPIDVRYVCRVLDELIPQDAIVVEEVTTHRFALNRLMTRTQPGTFFNGTYGGLGAGLGEALGFKLLNPDRLVVMPIGDGAFNYNPVLSALGFIQEYNAPILIIIFNNLLYASQKSGVLRLYPEGWAVKTGVFYGTNITPAPDYSALAKAFDGYGERVEEPADVRPALQRALEQVRGGRFAIVDILLDPRDIRRG